jgi:hypothetical protein
MGQTGTNYDKEKGSINPIVAHGTVLVGLAYPGAENKLSDDDASFYGGFIQLCFSSWPSTLRFDRHSWWFAIGASSRIVLVFGSFAGIVLLLESYDQAEEVADEIR